MGILEKVKKIAKDAMAIRARVVPLSKILFALDNALKSTLQRITPRNIIIINKAWIGVILSLKMIAERIRTTAGKDWKIMPIKGALETRNASLIMMFAEM